MRRPDLLAAVELAIGIGMLAGFLGILFMPATFRFLVELFWAIGLPHDPPGFGINPHRVAEARYAPSLAVLAACAALAVCYRWLTSRRRG
jgi:hypothetical protein